MKSSLQKLVLLALISALNVAVARIFLIPVPFTNGNLNLCDAGIVLAALLYGRRAGATVGALSGLLLDLLGGYPQYMLFSLVIHGAQGAVVGAFYKSKRHFWKILGLAVGVLVGGSFIADSLLYGFAAGFLGLGTNLLQGLCGTSVGYFLYKRLKDLPSLKR